MRLRFLLSIVLALAVGAARAQEPSPDVVVAGALPQGTALAPTLLPIEQVLASLRAARGYAFIFDSRLLAGKTIAPIEASENALKDALKSANLRLHEVAPKTFAITAEPVETVEAPPAPFDAEDPIDTILVMGTSPVETNLAGSKHIFTIDADDLAYLSLTSPAEAIYELPQSLASFTASNTALFGATAGINLADLRGLQPRRTMVLVNGRRRTLTTGGNDDIGGVDLNSIADPFLERIEVQSLPGGARFGGAAVAGVINFVTKSNLDGLEAGARAGISERGDSEQISLHAIGGRQFGSANLTIGLNAVRSEGLIGADREFSAPYYGFGAGGVRTQPPMGTFQPGYGGSSYTGKGIVAGAILSDGSFASARSQVPNPGGTISPFIGSLDQLFDAIAWQSIILPSDRVLGLASFSADAGGGWRVFAEAHAGVSANDGKLAPVPGTRGQGVDPVVADAAVIPLTNPTLPQSIRDFVTSQFGASAKGVVFEHRYVELGPRRQNVDRRYLDIAAGAEKGGADDVKLSLSYRYGNNRVVARDFDRIDRNRLQVALDPALCAATAGCVPVDFFTTPEISRSALDYIAIPEIRRVVAIEEHEALAAIAAPLRFGDFDGVAAAGVEMRRAKLSDRDFAPAGSAPIGRLPGADNEGALTTFEAYAEVETPLVRLDSFPGEIEAALAIRTEKSDRFDYSMNFEAGVDWRPVEGIALFTRQLVGARTPDLIELFSVGSTLEMAFADPCDGPTSTVAATNCTSAGPLGVGAGFVQTAPLATTTSYGNPDLDPERIRSAAYGAALAPTDLLPAIPGRMQLTATWLDFEIKDAISSAGTLDACYESKGFSHFSCGFNPRTGAPAIRRDPITKQVLAVDNVLHNGGALSWRGLDVEFRYAVQPPRLFESVWLTALHTYTDKVESTSSSGAVERLDGLVDFPQHRTLVSLGADVGRWSIVGYANRRGRALTRRIDIPEARIPAALYLDATVRLDLTNAAYVQASVQNLTDEEPAITAFNDIGNFAPEYYDPVGRRYALSVRVTF